jgi:hypothetical protein
MLSIPHLVDNPTGNLCDVLLARSIRLLCQTAIVLSTLQIKISIYVVGSDDRR